jgi:hypothetical protein
MIRHCSFDINQHQSFDIKPLTFDINQSSFGINQFLDINLFTSHLTSINQSSFGINDNMIQQYPPLALMAIPTLMSTPIIDGNM